MSDQILKRLNVLRTKASSALTETSEAREAHWNSEIPGEPLTTLNVRNDVDALCGMVDIRMTGFILTLNTDELDTASASAPDSRANSSKIRDAIAMLDQVEMAVDKLRYLRTRLQDALDQHHIKSQTRTQPAHRQRSLFAGQAFLNDVLWKTEAVLRGVARMCLILSKRLQAFIGSDHRDVALIHNDLDPTPRKDKDHGAHSERQEVFKELSQLWSSISSRSSNSMDLETDPMSSTKDLPKDNQEAVMRFLIQQEDLISDIVRELDCQIRVGKSLAEQSSNGMPAQSHTVPLQLEIDDDGQDRDALSGRDLQRAQVIAPLIRLARLALQKCIERRIPLLALPSPGNDTELYNIRVAILDEYKACSEILLSSLDDLVSLIEPDMAIEELQDLASHAITGTMNFVELVKATPPVLDSEGHVSTTHDDHEKWFDMALGQLLKMKARMNQMLA